MQMQWMIKAFGQCQATRLRSLKSKRNQGFHQSWQRKAGKQIEEDKNNN